MWCAFTFKVFYNVLFSNLCNNFTLFLLFLCLLITCASCVCQLLINRHDRDGDDVNVLPCGVFSE